MDSDVAMSIISFSDEIPSDGVGTLISYDYELVIVEGWPNFDVREIVHLYEDCWLSEIDAWHRELSEQAVDLTRWWWITPGSRLTLWKTNSAFSLKPVLFTLAIIKLCEHRPSEKIWIVGAPDEVVVYLSDFAIQKNSIQIEDFRPKNLNSNIAYKLSNFLKPWLKLARWLAYSSFHSLFSFKRKRIKPARLIVDSLVLDVSLIKTIGDHFFGHMLDNIPGLASEDVIWKYEDPSANFPDFKKNLTDLGKRANFKTNLFCWSDIWFALSTSFSVNKALSKLVVSPPVFRIGDFVVSSFPHYFISNLVIGNLPLSELILYKQCSRLILESGASAIIYPYEEKPAERAILLAVQDNASQIKTIAFAHAAYSKGHLYIRRGKRGEPPRPDVLAVTGSMARDQFHRLGVPLKKIIVTGSPRHHTVPLAKRRVKLRKQILFICGLGFEMRIFALLLTANPGLLDGYDLVIRRSYHSWVEEQDAAEDRMRAAGIIYRCEGGDLAAQIDDSDIVLFEASTAGLEAVLRGKLAIRLNLSDIITTSHFNGCDGSDVIKYCQNLKELKCELDRIALLTPVQYEITLQRQRNLVERLYTPIDQAALAVLFEK